MAEPPVTIEAVHSSAGANLPPTRVVIHCTSPGDPDPASRTHVPFPAASAAGTARGTAGYFHQQSSGGSAHYVCDIANEEHTLAEMLIAWHAPPNAHSIGIEVCGQPFYTTAQWLSPEVWPAVQRAALRARDVCDRRGVPWQRIGPADLLAGAHGVCGHVDVTAAFHESDHTDPGPNFPWDQFMAAGAPATHPIPWTEVPDMIPVVDTKAVGPNGLTPNWESNAKGEMFAWNGARTLRNLADFAPEHPPIVAITAHPSGDGVILFGDDRREDPPGSGRYVRSTYAIRVGM